MSEYELDTPVVFSIFNRPAHTRTVFDIIAAARPKKLFIIADGPRPGHPTDAERCRLARAAVEKVTWPCDVRMDAADANMGCRDRMLSGSDWVFGQVEEAIFLEDDTVPHPDFFRFCEELLRRYRDDRRVMSITGLCLRPLSVSAYSYGFSTLACGWGRACWRRSWEAFDPTMSLWPEVRDNGLLSQVFPDRAQAAYWHQIMESTYRGRFDSWGYPFILSCWLLGGLTAMPGRNLVRNIGFGADSTHTKLGGGLDKLALEGIDFPLRHPPIVTRDYAYDEYAFRRFIRRKSLPSRLVNKARRILDERRFQGGRAELLHGRSLF